MGLSRDSYRHTSAPSALNVQLREHIVQTAHAHRRWGYRMIHDVLRPQYPGINHKRLYRIYSAEALAIRKRKKTKRIGVRVPLVAALALNQTWSIDFVSDAIARPGAVSRRIKCLTVADDFSHEYEAERGACARKRPMTKRSKAAARRLRARKRL